MESNVILNQYEEKIRNETSVTLKLIDVYMCRCKESEKNHLIFFIYIILFDQ